MKFIEYLECFTGLCGHSPHKVVGLILTSLAIISIASFFIKKSFKQN